MFTRLELTSSCLLKAGHGYKSQACETELGRLFMLKTSRATQQLWTASFQPFHNHSTSVALQIFNSVLSHGWTRLGTFNQTSMKMRSFTDSLRWAALVQAYSAVEQGILAYRGDFPRQGNPRGPLRQARSWQLSEEWLMRHVWDQKTRQGPSQRVCLIYPGLGQCLHPHRAAEGSVDLSLWVGPGPFSWERDRQRPV